MNLASSNLAETARVPAAPISARWQRSTHPSRPRARVRLLGVVVLTASLLAAACSSSGPSAHGSSDSSPPAASPAGADGSWTANGLPVHSMLTATKDSIVYAGVDDETLQVVALDPTTGAERWRQPSEVGLRVAGVELIIYTDESTAYFLTSSASGGSSPVAYRRPTSQAATAGPPLQLTAVTTATGETRWSTPIVGDAFPNAQRCGSDVCLVVSGSTGHEMWRFDRASGAVLGQAPISLPQGPGDDALVSAADHDTDLSQFLVASRGPVLLGQYSADGAHLDWSQPASALFGATPVSPSGGWAAWSSPAGWVVWLGPDTDASTPRPQPGDHVTRGAVAGVGADGAARWLRADRHPCFFLMGDVPTLCDGDIHVLTSDQAEARPSTIEGIDEATGATTWTVDLQGSLDELHASGQVLRIDDATYLVTTPAGLTRIDLATGPEPAADDDAVGWCQPDRGESDKIRHGTTVRSYVRSPGYHPCRMGGASVAQPTTYPVPRFAGVDAEGWSAWIVDGQVHGQQGS